jgi:peptidoglycan/LPS O-acetylase OafA/YrhL
MALNIFRPSARTKKNEWIQILRGFAVLAVLFFHLLPNIFPSGYLGVDLFFVISGYVITPQIIEAIPTIIRDSTSIQMRDFFRKRIRRLIPALISTVTISTILILIIAPLNDQIRYSRDAIASMLGLGNIGAYRWAGNYFSPSPNPMLHTWSLAVEEQIYLVLPWLMLAVSKVFKKHQIRIGAFLLAILISLVLYCRPQLAAPVYGVAGLVDVSSASFYSPVSRLWEFLLGGFLAVYFLKKDASSLGTQGKSPRFREKQVFIFLIILLAFSPVKQTQRWITLIDVLGYVLCLAFIRHQFKVENYWLSCMAWIGDNSYSIYLIHFPLIYLFRDTSLQNIVLSKSLANVLIFLLSIGFGHLNFRFVEFKFRQLGSSRSLTPRQRKFFFGMPLSIGLLLVGMSTGMLPRALGDFPRGMVNRINVLTWDNHCKFHDGSTPCIYGNRTSNTGSLFLLGDSHAAMFSRLFVNVARTSNIRLTIFTASNCKFVLPSDNPDQIDLPEGCYQHNVEILNYLKAHPVDTLVASYDSAPTKQVASLLSNLDILLPYTSHIILLGPVPEYNASTYLNSAPSSQARLETQFVNSIPKNVRFVDTYSVLCPDYVCSKGILREYQDYGHLNEDGANLLATQILRALDNMPAPSSTSYQLKVKI